MMASSDSSFKPFDRAGKKLVRVELGSNDSGRILAGEWPSLVALDALVV